MNVDAASNELQSAELARQLSLGDSIAIVVGMIIGGGIFLVPNLVARSLPSAPMIMAVWLLSGVISFICALACAELGAAFPATGGQYVFLRECGGRASELQLRESQQGPKSFRTFFIC